MVKSGGQTSGADGGIGRKNPRYRPLKNVLETLRTDITFFFRNSFLRRQVDEDKRDVRIKRAREICRRKLFETSKRKRYFTDEETSYKFLPERHRDERRAHDQKVEQIERRPAECTVVYNKTERDHL